MANYTLTTYADGAAVKDALDKGVSAYNGKLYANVTYYIATTGNDTTGTGAIDAPFKTIAHFNTVCPKNLNGNNLYIYLNGGTYDESIDLSWFTNGEVIVTLLGNVICDSLQNWGSTCVTITGAYSVTTNYLFCTRAGSMQFNAEVSINLTNVTLNGYAVLCSLKATLLISGTLTFNASTANYAVSVSASHFYANTIAGSIAAIGLRSTKGGILTYTTKTLTAGTEFDTADGGRIYSSTQTNAPSY